MIAEMDGLAEGENERKRVPSRWQDQKPSAVSARSPVCGRAADADIAGGGGAAQALSRKVRQRLGRKRAPSAG